jgi:hypothetical protein
LLAGGFVVGLLVGRWFALLAAVGIGRTTEVELPHWFLGLGYAAVAAVGIAAGLGVRRVLRSDQSAQ